MTHDIEKTTEHEIDYWKMNKLVARMTNQQLLHHFNDITVVHEGNWVLSENLYDVMKQRRMTGHC